MSEGPKTAIEPTATEKIFEPVVVPPSRVAVMSTVSAPNKVKLTTLVLLAEL
jgi:hypothetical protein